MRGDPPQPGVGAVVGQHQVEPPGIDVGLELRQGRRRIVPVNPPIGSASSPLSSMNTEASAEV